MKSLRRIVITLCLAAGTLLGLGSYLVDSLRTPPMPRPVADSFTLTDVTVINPGRERGEWHLVVMVLGAAVLIAAGVGPNVLYVLANSVWHAPSWGKPLAAVALALAKTACNALLVPRVATAAASAPRG